MKCLGVYIIKSTFALDVIVKHSCKMLLLTLQMPTLMCLCYCAFQSGTKIDTWMYWTIDTWMNADISPLLRRNLHSYLRLPALRPDITRMLAPMSFSRCCCAPRHIRSQSHQTAPAETNCYMHACKTPQMHRVSEIIHTKFIQLPFNIKRISFQFLLHTLSSSSWSQSIA